MLSVLRPLARLATAVLLLAGPVGLCAAAMDDPNLAGLITRKWTVEEGLPDNTVNALARTSDGFIWAATNRGLVRFDGIKAKAVTPLGNLSARLSVSSLCVDGEDQLWVSTARGFAVLKCGRSVEGPWDEGWPVGEYASAWALTPQGLVAATSYTGQYYRRTAKRWELILPPPGDPGKAGRRSLLCDGKKVLWALFGGRVYRLKNGAWVMDQPEGSSSYFSMTASSDGGFWALGEGVAVRRGKDGWEAPVPVVKVGRDYTCFMEDANGQLWLGTASRGAFRVDLKKGVTVQHLSSMDVRCFLKVGQRTLWIGTANDGAQQVWERSRLFQLRANTGELEGAVLNGVIGLTDGRVVISTERKGVVVGRWGQDFTPWPGAETLRRVQAITVDAEGVLWTARNGEHGLQRWMSGVPELVLPAKAQLQDFRALAQLPDGTMLIGGAGGIYGWAGGKVVPAELPAAALGRTIHAFLVTGAEAWAGGDGGLLLHRVKGRWQEVTHSYEVSAPFVSLARDDLGAIWIVARAGGLYRCADGTVSKAGLLGVAKRDMDLENVVVADGRLWLGTVQHVLAVRLDLARRAASGKGAAPIIVIGGKRISGMPWLRFIGSQSAMVDADGRPCFTTYNGGIMQMNLKGPRLPMPLRPVVLSLRIGEASELIASGQTTYDVPATGNHILVHVVSPDTETIDPVQLRSRLSKDDPWVASLSHEILLNQLPPGPHELEIQSSRLGHEWTGPPTTLTFNVATAWWNTWWGMAGIGLLTAAVLALVASIVSWRLRVQMRRASDLLAAREQALAQTSLFRHLLDASSDSIVIFDPATGRVSDANTTAVQRLTRPEKKLLESKIQELGPDWPEHVETLRQRHDVNFETTHLDQHGRTYPAEVAMRIATSPSGHPFGILISRDLTARQAAQEHAQSLQQQLQESQKLEAVGHLAGGVAHDFNNILQIIHGCVEIVRAPGCGEPRRQQHLEQITLAADRAAQLTGQLLAFGRRAPVESALVDLGTALPQSLTMIRRLIGTHIEVTCEADSELPLIQADPVQIDQILMNLAVNARDAMPEGGTIRVQARIRRWAPETQPAWAKPGPWVALIVADNGKGMDDVTRARVFEPFFTTKPIGKGTGLGLSVVYGLVHSHGGHVQIESSPASGTTVSVYFPAFQPSLNGSGGSRLGDEPAQSQPSANGQHHGAVILFADDDPAVRPLTIDMLTHAGHEVLPASNGLDAVASFQQHAERIDLVILDVLMPELTGTEAATRIRQLSGTVPIIFCSGYTGAESLHQESLPANARVIFKPYGANKLLNLITEVLAPKPEPTKLSPCGKDSL